MKWLHLILGHSGEQDVRATARYYGINLKGDLEPCAPCAMGKGCHKNLPKEMNPHAAYLGYCLMFVGT